MLTSNGYSDLLNVLRFLVLELANEIGALHVDCIVVYTIAIEPPSLRIGVVTSSEIRSWSTQVIATRELMMSGH